MPPKIRSDSPNSPTSGRTLGRTRVTTRGIKKNQGRLRKKPRTLTTFGKYWDIVTFFKGRNITALTLRDDSEEYRKATETNNLVYRFQQADCVVQPINASQVQTIVKHAKAEGVRIIIKNGGHSYSGSSTAKEGILLDLSKMRSTQLEFKEKLLTVESGALWGHAIRGLTDSDRGDKHNGWLLNGGRCLNVGVTGFLLGGGTGPFTRKFGMGCDSIKEINIVTADGELVTVSDRHKRDSNEGQLFWALCGAGQGSFGVVTSIKMKLHQLKYKSIVHGRFIWTPEPDEDILQIMADFYSAKWSNDITIDTTWLADLQEPAIRSTTAIGVRFNVYFDGTLAQYEKEIQKHIKNRGLARMFTSRCKSSSSSQWAFDALPVQWAEETRRTRPDNNTWQLYSGFCLDNVASEMRDITTAIVELLEEYRQKFRGEKTSLVNVVFIHSGGLQAGKQAVGTKSASFPWRKTIYHAYVMVEYIDNYLHDEMRELSNRFRARLRPFSLNNGSAAFVNFPDELIAPTHHEKAYYGTNATLLQEVKQYWDPDDFFHWDQSIGLPKLPGSLPEVPDDKEPDDKRMWSGDNRRNDREAAEWESFRLPPGQDFLGQAGLQPMKWPGWV